MLTVTGIMDVEKLMSSSAKKIVVNVVDIRVVLRNLVLAVGICLEDGLFTLGLACI